MPPHTTSTAARLSRRPRATAVACAALVWTLAGAVSPSASGATGFRQSGIVGGGFVNVITVDPSGSGLVIAGGDVSGLQRSTDFGDTWTQVNTGITGIDQLKVASVAFSPSTPGEVYAGVGDEGRDGGVLVSTDAGITWELRSTVPQFSGGNNDGWATLPQKHPRSTGSLFAFDPGRDLVYAATFESGVYRSDDHGYTWTPLGASGHFLRSIAIDPANPDVLYVAGYGDGVFKTTDASETGTFTGLPFAPARPEELAMVGSDLYAAAGSAGIYVSANGGANWSKLGGATVPSGPVWMSIAGYRACGQEVLYAGAEHGNANGVMRSTDGGTTWTSLVADPTLLHDEIGGAGGEHWWLYKPAWIPGGSFYTASSLAIDPSPPPDGECVRHKVFLAGRSGIWRSTDGGADWYPAIRDLGVSIVRGVAFDPTQPGRTFTAMVDWVQINSSDYGDHVTQKRPGGGAAAFDVEVNAGSVPPREFVATGSPWSRSSTMILAAREGDLAEVRQRVDEGEQLGHAGLPVDPRRVHGVAARPVRVPVRSHHRHLALGGQREDVDADLDAEVGNADDRVHRGRSARARPPLRIRWRPRAVPARQRGHGHRSCRHAREPHPAVASHRRPTRRPHSPTGRRS